MDARRVVPVVLVVVVLICLVLVMEPLRDMYTGMVSFNAVGYAAFLALTVASAVGVFLIVRARRLDPNFRGVTSELTRLLALGELAALLVAWILYLSR